MKLARIEYQGEVYPATLSCNGYALQDGTVVPAEEARLMPPVTPGKILGVGWNFPAHIREMVERTAAGQKITEPPKEEVPPPILFFKPSSSLIGHGDAIVYPADATRVEYEGELAVVISRETRRVSPEEASLAVLGWTCANDVTERDMQSADKQWHQGQRATTAGGPGARHDPGSLHNHLPDQPGHDPLSRRPDHAGNSARCGRVASRG